MQKHKIVYIITILLFIIAVFCMTFTYLIINKQMHGKVNINEKYFDIVFNNTYISYNSSASLKINNEEKTLHINIPNLNEIQSDNSFIVDITNIGNIDKEIYTDVTNFYTNVSENDVLVDILLDNGNIIKGGETKRIRINVSYNNIKNITNPSLSFNVNLDFE